MATGGGCSGSYTYQWQLSTDGVNFSTIAGATALNYTPGTLTVNTWYRRQVTCGSSILYSNNCQVTINTGTPDINFIRVRDILKAGVLDSATALGLTSPYDVAQVTQYFDGLGRQIQTVSMRITPQQKDLVSFNTYDVYNRETYKYLPYAATTNDGNFKVTALVDQYNFNAAQFTGEQYYYSQTNYESSPLNRVDTAFSPGMSWEGSGRGVSSSYLINAAADSVRYWTIAFTPGSIPTTTAIYGAGTLFKGISIDEAGHQVVEYKDMQGKVILKKVMLSATPGTAHVGWLCTYYVYDDLDNLRFVIQPQAVNDLLLAGTWNLSSITSLTNELCFRYEYDYRKRLSIKKIPGAGEAWMVYDIRDRLVMSQDSLLRSTEQWLYTKYDGQNRPDSSGLLTDPTYYNNLSYNQNAANASSNYPVVANYTTSELRSQTFYDDYSWVSGTGASIGSSMATNETSNSNYFITSYNTSPVYSQALTPFVITRGSATGGMSKVIGTTNQYLYSVNFYDDRGRILQTQKINYTGGTDTTTVQYDFSGKPLRQLVGHKKLLNTMQAHTVLTKMDYDQGFRLRHIYKNIDNASTDQLIDSMQYNELGQLRAKYFGNNIDSVIYDYNIRGWMTGINKAYVGNTATHYFGMELGYNNQTSVAGTTSYTNAQYSGNITGTVWKSAGDGIGRKYDFTYDNINRITAANFTQNTSGSSWDNSYINFTTNSLSYDGNGNILTMNQQGFKVGGSALIDQLTYSYQLNTNKLSQVNDAVNDTASKLGDFHYKGTKQATDYSYDGDGNLLTDNNKGIDKINYNLLNQPQLVHVNTKGNIQYIYDATGNKLKKITTDSLVRHITNTLYIGEFIYQQTDTITNPSGGTDTLQFIAHEEGRVRWAWHTYTTGATAYGYEYDFFEKDHLGNTRMVLTQEKDTSKYLASMEAAFRGTEVQLFNNITTTCAARNGVPGYPDDLTYTNPNDSVSKLNGNGPMVGPSLLLKVMSGDKIDLSVQSYYNGTGTPNAPNNSFTNVLNSLVNGIVSMSSGGKGTVTQLTGSGSPVYTGLTSFLAANDPVTTGKPKAYLNWILLDDQLKYVSSYPQSGAIAAGSSATLNTLAYTGIPITKNGFLYIWVSNETPSWDAFFDNLKVTQYTGPELEETHYYPFGLTMAGISDKALKPKYAQNNFRFNGKELQNQEFSDGTGLEDYDFGARMQDPQLGVWHNIDPLAAQSSRWSPYNYTMDNPLRFIDPDGMSALYDCETCGPPISEQHDDNLDDELRGRDFLKDAMNKEIDKDIEKLSKVDIDFRDDPFYNPGNRPNPKPDRDQKLGNNKLTRDAEKGGDGGGNKKKGKDPNKAAKSSSSSSAGDILKAGLKAAGTIELVGGGPEDIPADGIAGVVVIGTLVVAAADFLWNVFADNTSSENTKAPAYPTTDPTVPPGAGWEWRGQPGSAPGSKEGNWYNPNTDQSLRPDLDHPPGQPPHWDYKSPSGKWYRYLPDGSLIPKK